MVVGTRSKHPRADEAEPGTASKSRRSAATTAAEQKPPAAATAAKPKANAKPAAKPKAKAAPSKKVAATKAATQPSGSGAAAGGTVTVNRAPVLTLWVAVVAQRQGYRCA